jgi:hypothetical protein
MEQAQFRQIGTEGPGTISNLEIPVSILEIPEFLNKNGLR